MLMNVLTHEAPARRRSRASAPAATKEAPPSGVRRADRDAPVAEPGAYFAAVKPRLAALRALDPTALARN